MTRIDANGDTHVWMPSFEDADAYINGLGPLPLEPDSDDEAPALVPPCAA